MFGNFIAHGKIASSNIGIFWTVYGKRTSVQFQRLLLPFPRFISQSTGWITWYAGINDSLGFNICNTFFHLKRRFTCASQALDACCAPHHSALAWFALFRTNFFISGWMVGTIELWLVFFGRFFYRLSTRFDVLLKTSERRPFSNPCSRVRIWQINQFCPSSLTKASISLQTLIFLVLVNEGFHGFRFWESFWFAMRCQHHLDWWYR